MVGFMSDLSTQSHAASLTSPWFRANALVGAAGAVLIVGTIVGLVIVFDELHQFDSLPYQFDWDKANFDLHPEDFLNVCGFVFKTLIAGAVPFLLFGVLTAHVLGSRLPGFPTGLWIGLHGVVGFLDNVSGGMLVRSLKMIDRVFNEGGREFPPPQAAPEQLVDIAQNTLVSAVLIGLVFGSLQAFLMRKVARGLGVWIMCSALASLAGQAIATTANLIATLANYNELLALMTGYQLPVTDLQELTLLLAFAALVFAVQMAMALIMTPAVNRLRPR
jgi:hypothetical protein